jgi:hypothetical protein
MLLRWVKARTASQMWDLSRSAILRRALDWQDDYVPHRIRRKYLQLDDEGELAPRYYRPDVEALRNHPPTRESASRVPILNEGPPRAGNLASEIHVAEEELSNWQRGGMAGKYCDLSSDSVERRAIPMWVDRDGVRVQQDYFPYKIRYDELQLSKGGRIIKRYYLPDLDALLVARPSQPPVNLTPAFHMEKSGSRRDA